jgi:hypothetical protein
MTLVPSADPLADSIRSDNLRTESPRVTTSEHLPKLIREEKVPVPPQVGTNHARGGMTHKGIAVVASREVGGQTLPNLRKKKDNPLRGDTPLGGSGATVRDKIPGPWGPWLARTLGRSLWQLGPISQ